MNVHQNMQCKTANQSGISRITIQARCSFNNKRCAAEVSSCLDASLIAQLLQHVKPNAAWPTTTSKPTYGAVSQPAGLGVKDVPILLEA
ncbi:uncharacterized protein TrAtP1_006478 [Trichoderma atroviride]|uniref:uncharacterized protein n=1 Tax=Hypocrea atroviridis TaxID=63577 RepID=UPI00332C0516|nr:hypothetical protein TrAtP1_006478 [Trichoderma atroviride]